MSERDKDFGLTQLLRFCRANDERGECFADWPNDILLHWLRWHWEAGNLYCFADGDELVTVAVGWKLREGDLDDHITKYWGSAGEVLTLSMSRTLYQRVNGVWRVQSKNLLNVYQNGEDSSCSPEDMER